MNTALIAVAPNQIVAEFQAACPEVEFFVVDVIEHGERTLVNWTMRGTPVQVWMGQQPSGRQQALAGTSVYLLSDGQVVKSWHRIEVTG